MLRVWVLGELAIERDGVALEPPAARRARSLLVWLATNPGVHPRSQVAGRFWPDVLDHSARASLRGALSELRGSLGPDAARWLVATRDRVGLGSDGDVWVDARAVTKLEAEGKLAEASELCGRGELLAGRDEEWVFEARELHRARVDGILERLAVQARDVGDAARAVELTRERVALDPLSEDAGRALIERLVAAGDRAAALAAYRLLSDRLRVQLGVAPSALTRALVESVRAAPEPDDATERRPIARPAILRRRFRSAFAAREAEVGRLLGAWKAAASGERVLALVAGEPGVGKTRLAIEVARRIAAADAIVLYGRCHEEALVPYRPFIEALAPVVPSGSWDDELRPLVPDLAPAGRTDDGEAARYRFLQAVDRLIARLSVQRPTLLVLDDLHWADKPTLLVLTHLAHSPEPAALLIVGTYRETEPGRTHPLAAALADLHRDPGVERVRLPGLDEAGTSQLMAGWMPIEIVPGLLPSVQAQTEGNPFFIEEVLAHLRETGKPIEELGVPDSIRDAVRRRLRRLPERTWRAVSLAAVIGREFSVDVLAHVAGLAAIEVEEALEPALAAGLLHEERDRAGRYSFSHALVREALYTELTLARRLRLHGQIAAAIEQLDAGTPGRRLEEIAFHLYEAAPGGEAKRAVDYGARAAARAIDQLAYEDAAAHCARALEILDHAGQDDPGRGCELLLTLGDARLRAGEREAARAAFTAAAALARERDNATALARAALGFAGLSVTIVRVDERAVALLDEALSALGDDQALRARLLARLAVELYYAPSRDRSDGLSRDAIAAARGAGDPGSLGFALNARHVALWRPDRLNERLRIADEMVALGDSVPEIGMQGVHWRVVDLFEAGDLESCRDAMDEHARRAEALRLPAYRWYRPVWDCTLAAIAGRFGDAWRLREAALDEGRRAGDPNAELFAEMHRQLVLILQRRFSELDLTFFEDKVATSPAAPAYRTALAWLYAELGRLDDARPHWEWVSTGRFARIPFDVNWMSAMAEIAEAAALLGDRDNAHAAYELLAPYADRNLAAGRAVFTYGSAHHYLGLLALTAGRPRAAVDHLATALTAHQRMGSPPLAAVTRWWQARALRASGERAEANNVAAEAHAAARRLAIKLPAE